LDYGTFVQENPGVHLGWNQHLFHRGVLVRRNFYPPFFWRDGGFHWGLPREIHDSDSAAYFTGACPVKFTTVTAQRISLGSSALYLQPFPCEL